jgi:hypothetical protein
MHSATSATWRRCAGALGLALGLLLGRPQAWACGWWEWGCKEGGYGYRQPARARRYDGYGYSGFRRAPRARGYYFNYPAGLPSTYLRRNPVSGPALPDAGSGGLTAPYATADGLLETGLPARGPTLFGPPAPPPGSYGYNPTLGYYSGYAYYGPSGFYTYSGPPPPTAWLERRRR